MEEFMSFVTIDVWTLIFTWGNLIILYLLLKKFLFKPVNNVLDAREKEISDMYSDAETAKSGAENMRDEYTKRLTGAKQEAENILSSAKKRTFYLVQSMNVRFELLIHVISGSPLELSDIL